jgi:hypothetical protein
MRNLLAGSAALSIAIVALRALEDMDMIPEMKMITHDALPHMALMYTATLHGYYWARRHGASTGMCWMSAVAFPLVLGTGIEVAQTFLMDMQNPDALRDSMFNLAGFIPGAYTLFRYY